MHTIKSHFAVTNGPMKQSLSNGGHSFQRIQMLDYLVRSLAHCHHGRLMYFCSRKLQSRSSLSHHQRSVMSALPHTSGGSMRSIIVRLHLSIWSTLLNSMTTMSTGSRMAALPTLPVFTSRKSPQHLQLLQYILPHHSWISSTPTVSSHRSHRTRKPCKSCGSTTQTLMTSLR